MANRALVIGWDGADWDGLDPGGHGVFDILEYRPGVSRRLPVSSRSILAPTWPEHLSAAGKTSVVLNVPLTYPPPEIRGVMIAGGVVPPGTTYSHPADAGPRLDWPINGGSWTTFRNRPVELVEELEELTRKRGAAMRTLLDEKQWDAACLVFVSPDRAQHCLLEYVHPGHPAYSEAAATPIAERVRDLYRLLDRELASLLERADEEDLVVLMSDHGHQPVTRSVSMNKILEHEGFLRFGAGSRLVNLLSWGRVRSLARIVYDRLGLHGRVAVPTPPPAWAPTRAYTSVVSTGEGVSVNLVGREPHGTVDRGDYERVREEIAQALLEFEDPDTGKRPIGSVVRKEEVLSGPYLDRAPDLLLQPAPLYSLTHSRHLVEEADWLSGDHRPEGIYVEAGPGVEAGRGPEVSLTDFAGRIADAVGLEPDPEWGRATEPETVAVFSEEEERAVEERL